jgi:hypothetical protein
MHKYIFSNIHLESYILYYLGRVGYKVIYLFNFLSAIHYIKDFEMECQIIGFCSMNAFSIFGCCIIG